MERLHTERRQLEKKEPCTAPVPSMSSSCPWLPSSVLDRKGAKSTKISLSRGATFSRARSSLVVMLWCKRNKQRWREDTAMQFNAGRKSRRQSNRRECERGRKVVQGQMTNPRQTRKRTRKKPREVEFGMVVKWLKWAQKTGN